MKIGKLVLLSSLAFSLTLSAVAETPKLVVAILVDQLRYDYLERFHDQFGPGGFKLFTEEGAFMTFARYNYAQTVTGPGHASFLSGSTPAVHGIVANDWFDKRTRKQVYCCDDSTVTPVGGASAKGGMSPRNFIGATFADQMRLHYRSKVVGISMKDRGAILPAGKKPLGAYWFDSASGEFVTSTYYMTELPDWVKQFNGRKRPAEFMGKTWDRLLDAKAYQYEDNGPGEGTLTGEKSPTFPHTITGSKEGFEAIMPTPFGNQVLAEFVQAAIEGEHLGTGPQPDLLCVSFSSIDYCGHKFGPYSQEVQDITLRFDRQLAGLTAYLDKQFGLANVLLVLTADHGVAPNPEFAVKEGLDGQRFNESEFMVDLMAKLDAKFGPGKYFLTPKLYEGNIYFNHDTLLEKKLSPAEVAGFIRETALVTGKIQACFSREQLLDGRAPGLIGQLVLNGYNAERGGDVVMITKPFMIPAGAAKTGTTHGSLYTYDTHIPVLFHGPAFKPGRYADEFYITDIVPTLCAALHMDEPPGCMGKPFVKVLIQP